MSIFKIERQNIIPTVVLAIFLMLTFFISTIPNLQSASFLYGFLVVIGLFFYTNPGLQSYVIGIPKGKLLPGIIMGSILGFGILIIPKFGLSIGVPLIPQSIESNLRWLVICGFAPIIEEIATRGAVLGLIKYLAARGKKLTTLGLWSAILIQAVFFTIIHFTAYSAGWYTAPDISSAYFQISAVSASLISAFIFAVIMGFAVTKTKNIAVSIAAHFVINQFLFVQIYSIFI